MMSIVPCAATAAAAAAATTSATSEREATGISGRIRARCRLCLAGSPERLVLGAERRRGVVQVGGRVVVSDDVAQVGDAVENLFQVEDGKNSAQNRALKDDDFALVAFRRAVVVQVDELVDRLRIDVGDIGKV